MPSINVSEADFGAVASAAMDALQKGDSAQARALDKIARRINASLSGAKMSQLAPYGLLGKHLTWRDVPSTIEQ